MDRSSQDGEGKKNVTEVTTFPVPFALGEIKTNITINTNSPSKPSKEQIINQAIQFHLKGNIPEASKYYQYCINQGFNDHRIFSNYGAISQGLGKLKEAELSISKAIELNPDFAEAHSNLGNVLKDLGKLQEAELAQRKAIELNPDFAEAHYNLGCILSDLGNFQDSELSLQKAIELKPDFSEAYYNLGNVLSNLGNLQDSELSLRKAVQIKPNFAQAHNNLGRVLNDLGRIEEAESCFRQAIDLQPDDEDAHTNLSLIELLKGNYESGFENYEYRLNKNNTTIFHLDAQLKQIGNKKLKKTEKLLLVTEQGLGDTLQYMRYIPYLRNQGLKISFCAQTKLHSLIQSSGIDQNPLTPEDASEVSEGKWIPLLSLPRYLKVSPDNPIISEPYIFSTNELKKKWKNILSKEKRPIIGINWQGNPNMEKTYQGRSIPLETFATLAKNNNFKLLSLQKGFGSEQLDHCSFKNKFVQCQQQIDSTWDFLENAAIIENCDLIITCDTSIAHLAGGMGRKVWLLLRDIPFWTWGLEGSSTFWYPSMRLFRQKERHNWQEVMERVSSKLNKELEERI